MGFCGRDYLREGGAAVEGGFAGAEEVEVGAVDEEEGGHCLGMVP